MNYECANQAVATIFQEVFSLIMKQRKRKQTQKLEITDVKFHRVLQLFNGAKFSGLESESW